MTQAEPQFLASENPNPVIRVDLAGRLLYANAAAQTVLQALNVKGDVKEKQLFPKKSPRPYPESARPPATARIRHTDWEKKLFIADNALCEA